MLNVNLKTAPETSSATAPPPEQLAFYEQYSWALNAFPKVTELFDRLREEVEALDCIGPEWQRQERAVNVWLLGCAVSDVADDFLLGARYDFSRAADVFAPARMVLGPLNRISGWVSRWRAAGLGSLVRWRDHWECLLGAYLTAFAAGADWSALKKAARELSATAAAASSRLPASLLAARPRIPAAFRSQDLTHWDAWRLGGMLAEAYPERQRPWLVVGLRTAGSYFAPLLGGYLRAQGYREVSCVTLRPKLGTGSRERKLLDEGVRRGAMAVMIDEPVFSASTVAKGLACLARAGFAASDVVALFPVHPQRRQWQTGPASLALARIRVLALEPEQWHKHQLLEPEAVRERLLEFLRPQGVVAVELGAGPAAQRAAETLAASLEPGFHCRLKRVYQVRVRYQNGASEERLILAKSAGWGWLGYHAFLAGTRLRAHVPPLLGVRDGILYSEWVDRNGFGQPHGSQPAVEILASYVVRRVQTLRLGADPTADLVRAGQHRGAEELAGILSGAYSSKLAAALVRPRIERKLQALRCDFATLNDAKMRPQEWLHHNGRLLKADFEHHGMGKHQLNVTDPAYDLAEAILHWELSEEQEETLLRLYSEGVGDTRIRERLYLYKLLAGSWAMARAAEFLTVPELAARHAEFDRRYRQARRFLVWHTVRFCAEQCQKPAAPRWAGPVVFLDVDGVLDKQIFGFPSTTAAGIKALSLLAAHGVTVALNTARSAPELVQYCRAYGFAGGVAEFGSYVWDAVSGRERVLLTSESLEQLDRLRRALENLPGVFVDDACRYSIKAYTYARGATVALPEMLVRNLMAQHGLDRLRLHQTYTDSTVIATDSDKGIGLRALLELADCEGLRTVAVGDSEPDLPMFAAAGRSYAPAQVSCRGPARLLGCRIAKKPYQAGLLEIVRHIVHPGGGCCPACRVPKPEPAGTDRIFLELLRVADRAPMRSLLAAALHPRALLAFRQ